MAVKQNNGDSGSSKSSDGNTLAENAAASQSYTLHQILTIIESLQSEEQKSRLRCFIVFLLAKAHMPKNPKEIKQYRIDLTRIKQFLLEDVDKSRPWHSIYLQQLYKIITEDEKPAPAIAVVFQLFPENKIGAALSAILSNSNNTTAELEIRKGVNVLCSWLCIYSFLENLNLWILAILNGLREQKRYNLNYLITIDNMEPLLKSLMIPVLRPQNAPVLSYFISSAEGLEVIARSSVIFGKLKLLVKENEDSSGVLQSLIELITTMLNQVEASKLVNFLPPTSLSTHKNPKVGLTNLGNTCYMNSIYQALIRTEEFSVQMLLLENQSPDLCRVQELMAVLRHSIRPSFEPTLAVNSTRPKEFEVGHQQDSSEFLSHVLEFMHDEELKRKLCHINSGVDAQKPSSNSNVITIVERNFGGKIQTSIKCLSCENISQTDATFRDLQLSFPEEGDKTRMDYDVQTLIEYYFNTEKLEGENQYSCENCKKNNDAERSICVVQSPKNLIITLKHFKYDQKTHSRKKLMHKVFHNESISLQLCCTNAKDKFNLYAVVVHSGYSTDSGHYFTYAKDDGRWYKFNDSFVITASISDIHGLASPDTPYILFYNKITSPNVATNENINLFAIENLPLPLKEFIARDNSRYTDEEDKKRKSEALIIKKSDWKNNRKNNGDKDDDPPSSCGGNPIEYNNNYVC